MGTRKLSFRLLLALAGTVFVLLAAACGDGGQTSEKEEPKIMRASTYTLPECTSNNTQERRDEVLSKYESLILRQPNWHAYGAGHFMDKNGEWLDISGIAVTVYPMVDQSTLPPEDRIPDCLEGIPVQIREQENTAEFTNAMDELRDELEDD